MAECTWFYLQQIILLKKKESDSDKSERGIP